jgi:hypothetical protein
MRLSRTVLLYILCPVLPLAVAACSGASAPREAADFLRQLHPERTFNVVCQQTDSDGDGYVSCTASERIAVVRMDGDPMPPPGVLLALECSSSFACSSGCRLQRARIGQ